MQIPDTLRKLIDAELGQLEKSNKIALAGEKRLAIYAAIGPSNVIDKDAVNGSHKANKPLVLSPADRIRARISLASARKVEPLWEAACLETEETVGGPDDPETVREQEERYFELRKQRSIEHISVYDVPRRSIAAHIFEMTELALKGEFGDYKAFRHEANEWWGIYGRPEQCEREYSIKWAAQDALYEAVGLGTHNPDPPADHALFAFAGIFEGPDVSHRTWSLDPEKQQQFWMWWLTEAIPQGFSR